MVAHSCDVLSSKLTSKIPNYASRGCWTTTRWAWGIFCAVVFHCLHCYFGELLCESAFFKQKIFSLELGPKNQGLIYFNLFFFKKQWSVPSAACWNSHFELMVACRGQSCSLWFGMLPLNVCKECFKGGVGGAIWEKVTSFHQWSFAQSLAWFARFQEIYLRKCELLEEINVESMRAVVANPG